MVFKNPLSLRASIDSGFAPLTPTYPFQNTWVCVVPNRLGLWLSQIMSTSNSSSWKRYVTRIASILTRNFLVHPLWVAHLHYTLLRSDRGLPVFSSTSHAFLQMAGSRTVQLWTGVTEAMFAGAIASVAMTFAQDVASKLSIPPRYDLLQRIATTVIAESLSAPFRLVAIAAATRTSFFSGPAYESYPRGGLSIAKYVWSKYGLRGFYSSFLPQTAHSILTMVVSTFLFRGLPHNARYSPFMHGLFWGSISFEFLTPHSIN